MPLGKEVQIKVETLWGHGWMVYLPFPGRLNILEELWVLRAQRQGANRAPERVAVSWGVWLAMSSLSHS